jgi:hypothetical protein
MIFDKGIYSLVCSVEMITYAYENIKSKPGNMTQGVTPETLDGISIDQVEGIAARLRDESFKFSPIVRPPLIACRRSCPGGRGGVRIIQIPKASGAEVGTRPLSIAPPLRTVDKIVQEALRLVLEAIFEPLFKDNSHGFRPNRSCHTALKMISKDAQPTQ